MEPIYRQTLLIPGTDANRYGRLKPSALLSYVQEIAGAHSALLGTDYDTLAAKGLFFAVIRHRVQITRLPRANETITLETWPMPTTRVAYPRSTVAYDAQGNELFRTIALWVLMDLNTRSMILPGKSGVIVSGTLRGTELAPPASLAPKALGNCQNRPVRFTDLDRNGHMNNARYLDWIDDLLPSTFHECHPLKDFILCYLNEAREEQPLNLTWELDSDGQLQVDILRNKDGEDAGSERIFAAKLLFDHVVL